MATSDTGFSVGREVGDDEVGIEVGADVGKAVVNTTELAIEDVNATLLLLAALSWSNTSK
jgi:hypothetical protein